MPNLPTHQLPDYNSATKSATQDYIPMDQINETNSVKVLPSQLYEEYGINTLPSGLDQPIANGDILAQMLANLQAQINAKTGSRVLAISGTVSGTNSSPSTINWVAVTKTLSVDVSMFKKVKQKLRITALCKYAGLPLSGGSPRPSGSPQIGMSVGGISVLGFGGTNPGIGTQVILNGLTEVQLAINAEFTIEALLTSPSRARFTGLSLVQGFGRDFTTTDGVSIIKPFLSDNSGNYYSPIILPLPLSTLNVVIQVGDPYEQSTWEINYLNVEFVDS